MANRPAFGETVNDLWQLLRAYALQETVTPLKALVPYIGYGLAAAVMTTVGLFLSLLGLLRWMQALVGDHLDANHNHSWGPYVVTVVVAAAVLVVLVSRVSRGFGKAS